MDPIVEQMRLEHARIAKFQKLWRSKRVFTNSQGSWKLSSSSITTMIVSFNLPTHFRAVFDGTPKGFTEVAGYKKTFKKPVVRWVPGQGWIGDSSEVQKVVAKRGKQTIVLSDKKFEVMGVGNYEEALLAIVKNGWAPKMLLRAPPKYTKIDGIFYANKPFNLSVLAQELRSLPGADVNYTQEDLNFGVPAVVLKLSNPKWTYQFFRNGTVIFTGIKNPSEKDAPRKLFKEFFTEHGLAAVLAVNLTKSPAIGKPVKGGNKKAKLAKLATRYREAKSWNMTPPPGFYVRPGTDGLPRLYKWRKMELEKQTGEWVDRGAIKLTEKNATIVAKAFAKANQPIPAHTRQVFSHLGFPLANKRTAPTPHYLLNRQSPAASVGGKAALKNRRAPSWNAVRNGFYVRPGPGKQPYWYAVPAGIAAGRKTVIKTYTDAGRNIPAEVRKIFKIPANVAVAARLQHVVKMGLNRILRINNRQATRLTKPELLGIARNMGIPEANDKMAPDRLIGLIKNKAGVTNKLNRTYDALVNGIFYKLLNNKRVEKTTGAGTQTRRAWNTIPVAEQNKIAKKILPARMHTDYNSMPKANRFEALQAIVAGKKPPSPAPPSPVRPVSRSPSVASSLGNNNFARELEYSALLTQNLGNLYRNGNEAAFLKIYNNIPKGARGKPLKTKVNAAYKKFVKNTSTLRANEPSRARYTAKIVPPNWLPANKVNAYKKLLTNLAFQKPKPTLKSIKNALKAWFNVIPRSPSQMARNVENMNTGNIIHIPARVPRERKTPNIPKRTPPPVKSPGAKAAAKAAAKAERNAKAAAKVLKNKLNKSYVIPVTNNVENLGSAMINAGLNTRAAHTWANVRRAGVNAKFKNVWIKHVLN